MGLQDVSQIIGTAAPAYAQVRQMRDQRKENKSRNELARAELASNMQISQNKLQFDQAEAEKKRQYDQGKEWRDNFYNPLNPMDDAARAEAMRLAPPGVFPPPAPPTPFPWEGTDAEGPANEGPALKRLGEAFSPEIKYPAMAKQPESIRAANRGKNADASLTEAKTGTEVAALPGVKADSEVKRRSVESRLLEQYLNTEVLRGNMSRQEADIALTEAQTRGANAKTDTDIAMRPHVVGKAQSDATVAEAEADYAFFNQEAGLDAKRAGTLKDQISGRFQESLIGPTGRLAEARVGKVKADTQYTQKQTGLLQQDANTRRMQAEASKTSASASALLASLRNKEYISGGPMRAAQLTKTLAEIDKLKMNESIPDGLRAEIDVVQSQMRALGSAGGNLGNNTALVQGEIEKLEGLMAGVPVITGAPAYGLSANAAYGYSRAILGGISLEELKAKYNADAIQDGSKPGEIADGLRRLSIFYKEFSRVGVKKKAALQGAE